MSNVAERLSAEFDYIGLVCSLIVFVFLWLAFKRFSLALIAFLPMALSWVWILAIMQLCHLQFNIVNIILATFIFGQGDDYTIFIVEGLLYERRTGKQILPQYRQSILLSALIMLIGIGILIFAVHPAMHSLGAVTLIGMAIVLLILILGANLGIKYYFKTRDDRKRLAELERQNLEQQLEYLRYQINPHFFMNTLNNIHALVDIDPEKAKDTILELSKMMRFVLYEGNKQGVPLSREMDFIRHYVTLMQLRYTDKVRITLDLPSEVPDRQIPPLILITFIENAFKHGVSYQHDSFIEAKVVVEGDKLRFSCRNSKSEKSNEERLQVGGSSSGTKGGVGLDNVRKRLNLLYDNRYSLNIKDEANTYCVQLNIPL